VDVDLIDCECEVFVLIVGGLLNKLIVCCLEISEKIVKVYFMNIYWWIGASI